MLKKILLSAALLSMPMAVASAQTPTPTNPNCTAWSSTEIIAANPLLTGDYLGCVGAFDGNVTTGQTWINFLRTTTAWAGGSSSGPFALIPDYAGSSNDVTPANGPFTSSPGGTSGTLTFDSALTGLFVVGLKAGDSFSFYAFNTDASVSTFAFSTEGTGCNPACTSVNGLSHAVLYRGTTTVPEPASFGLIAAGLAGLGVIARRRKA